MKNLLKAIYIISFLILSNACNDILKEEPASINVADIHYSAVEGIEDALKASYTPLRSLYGSHEGFFLTVTGTDIFTNGDGAIGRERGRINDYNLLSTNEFVETLWDQLYIGINQCNAVINKISDIENISENDRDRIIGEARFLRALYYFHLVQQFGPVHFTLEETEGVETEANRTPVNTIYEDGIIPDLEYAVSNLPESSENYGRAIKPAAEAILARVQLTIGNWERAETLANNVINNYDFQLIDQYSDLWDIENDINSEVIWSVQYTDDPLTQGSGNMGHLFFVYDYTNNPAMERDVINGRPWARFVPTNYLLNLYNRSIDSRWEGSFKSVWIANIEGEINGHTVAPGDTAIKIVMHEVPDEKQSSAPYWLIDYREDEWVGSINNDDWETGSINRMIYPIVSKFLDPLRRSTNEEAGQRDFTVVRLAEMYLIASEAAWQQGRSNKAAEYINVIRQRAAINGEENQMTISANDITLEFILDERAREFVGENHRWYDLKRTGKLLERVHNYNLDAAPNIEKMHLVRPIPQSQIDRVSNPMDFIQNEGY